MIEGFRFRRGLPREAVAPGTDVVDGDGKRIARARTVLVAAELPAMLRRRMKARALELTEVTSAHAALPLLARPSFDAVLVDVGVEGGGTSLVKWIKAGLEPPPASLAGLLEAELLAVSGRPLSAQLHSLAAARERHARTPFFVMMEGTAEWAVVVLPPEHAYLEDGRGLQLVEAIAGLDVGRLLLWGPPLA